MTESNKKKFTLGKSKNFLTIKIFLVGSTIRKFMGNFFA
jgi:hypothetical protein